MLRRAAEKARSWNMLTERVAARSQTATPHGAPAAPLVAISILNWNGWEDTLECLESVRRLDYPNYLVVVVDNGSTNGSADKIKAWAEANLGPGHVIADYSRETALAGGDPETEQTLDRAASPARMVLVRNDENLGFTGGHNVAFHYALRAPRPADYVFLLNNDASVDANCVTRLVSVARESGAGIAGAVILDGSGQHPYFNGRIDMARQFFYPIVKWHLPPPSTEAAYWDSDCVHGGAMMIRADVLNKSAPAAANTCGTGSLCIWKGRNFITMQPRSGSEASWQGTLLCITRTPEVPAGRKIPWLTTTRSATASWWKKLFCHWL